MSIYSMSIPGVQLCTIQVSPDNQQLSIGDTVTISASIKMASAGSGVTDVTFRPALRLSGYTDTHANGRYLPSDARRYFSVPSSTGYSHSTNGNTYTHSTTITVTENILAGLIETSGNIQVGYHLGITQSSGTKYSSQQFTTGLVVSSSGYTMPTLSTMSYADTATGNPLGTFGYYVQGKSYAVLSFAKSNITIDQRFGSPSYSKVQIFDPDGTSVYLGSKSISNTTSYTVGETGIIKAGTYTWSLWIEDVDGIGGITTGSYTVLAYAPPALTFDVARYTEILGSNNEPTYEESDDGENVWLDIEAVTTPLNGNNAWTLTLTYDPNDNGGTLPMTLLTGTDGETVTRTHDRTLVTETFSASNAYSFTATLTDSFGSAESYTVTAYIYKAGAFFNVEKTGVAVGMRSTGEPTDKKFEVAEDYTSHFYGGIAGVTTYPLLASGATATAEELTGGKWIDGKPIYRKVITWSGTLAATTTIGAYPSDLDTLVRCDVISNLSGATRPVPFVYHGSSNYDINWYLQESTGNIVMQCGSSARVSATVHFILEYTKTTD